MSKPNTDMDLQVIGAGFGRTGTLSMQRALEILGFGPCYHMTTVIMGPEAEKQKWVDLELARRRGDTAEFRAGLCAAFAASPDQTFKSTVDFPGCTYYKELLAMNPDAKVVLTERDSADAWFRSFSETISRVTDVGSPIERLAVALWPQGAFRRLLCLTAYDHPDVLAGRKDDAEACKQRYKDWNAGVKAHVPAEKLLVFNVKQGWQPLCKFLGVPVPEEPFPKLNEAKRLKRFLVLSRVGRYLYVACLAALSAALVSAGVRLLQQRAGGSQ